MLIGRYLILFINNAKYSNPNTAIKEQAIEAQNYSRKWILPGLIILGLSIRIAGINTESLSFDEIYSLKLAGMTLPGIIAETSRDYHPPFYYILLHFWITIWGNSEISVRMLSTLLGTAAIPAVFFISRLLFSEKAGLFAAFLLSVSNMNTAHSQEARMYALLSLLAVLSIYLFLKIREKNEWKKSALLILVNALLIYTHFYGFFIIAAEVLMSLFFWAADRAHKLNFIFRLAGVLAAVFLLYLPWLPSFLNQYHAARNRLWIPPASVWQIPEAITEYAGSGLLLLTMISLILLVFFRLERSDIRPEADEKRYLFFINRRAFPAAVTLLIWLFSPLILPYLISVWIRPILLVKYSIVASGAFIILSSGGFGRIRRRWVSILVILLCGGLSFYNIAQKGFLPRGERWREATEYIDKNAGTADIIIFNSGACLDLYKYYTLRKDIAAARFDPEGKGLHPDSIKAGMTPYLDKYNSVFLVLSHSKYQDKVLEVFEQTAVKGSSAAFYSYNRRYFFLTYYNSSGFDLYLLKAYRSAEIIVYQFRKKTADGEIAQTEKSGLKGM